MSIQRSLRFAETAQRVREQGAREANELAFMGRILVQATLPHSDPGDIREFSRSNGNYHLVIQPGPRVGIPFGSYPRLVLAWLTTEAVRTRSPRIELGESLSAFMRELGLQVTGGQRGTVGRFQEQMKRLFAARVSAVYEGDDGYQMKSVEVATDVDLWWTPHDPGQGSIWKSSVTLSNRFFTELVEHPIPLDMRVLREIKQSALALDLYMWLTYRVSRLFGPVNISWSQLHAQFGADYTHTHHFAAEAKKELEKIQLLWTGLRYSTPKGRLSLLPSPTHVARVNEKG